MRIIITIILVLHVLSCSGQAFTFVFLNSKPDKKELPKEEIDKIMKGHMDNINRLAKEGKLIVAGPFEGGGGIFILNTISIDEAKQWLSTDPGIQANRWNVELLPYTPKTGGVCAVGEPYEMVTYNFIRFAPQVTKVTTGNYPEILKRHDDYIKNQFSTSGNVIAEGTFGDQEGGILILKGELQKEIIEADPGVQEALLQFDIKKLWVAKGSFCEK
jgi:uncharacterized protein YciI